MITIVISESAEIAPETTDLTLDFKTAQIPSRAFQLDLRRLSAYKVGLEILPREIGNLRFLTLLDLSCNKLVQLPKEIGKLKALCYLDLSRNQLAKLPTSIRKLKLHYLGLKDNRLEKVPKGLGSQISHLSLAGNPLEKFAYPDRTIFWTDACLCANYYRRCKVICPNYPGKPELAVINCNNKNLMIQTLI